jgi:hypothetical protein
MADAGLSDGPSTLPLFDEQTTPAWLRQAIADSFLEQPFELLLRLYPPSLLPPIVVGGHRLSEQQALAVLLALQQSSVILPLPLLRALKQHADPTSLDALCWYILDPWVAAGTGESGVWPLFTIGLLGSDAAILQLASRIHTWIETKRDNWTIWAVESFRASGSDTALVVLHGLSQKARNKYVRSKALAILSQAAGERRLTKLQLEDRIVPDLGFDANGRRIFDYGARRFEVVFAADLKPRVRDEAGKLKSELPRPTAAEGSPKAEAALAEWKLLKKQAREIFGVQTERFERAMVSRRRWTVQEFEALILRHPLLIHMAQRILWAGYDGAGDRRRVFRVTEDRTYADVDEKICTLEGVESVGVIHPVHLSLEERARWGEIFSDYELIAPFPQLGRRIHLLLPEEAEARGITRFSGRATPIVVFLGILKKQHWTAIRRPGQRVATGHYKRFAEVDLTAIIEETNDSPATVRIEAAYFIPGFPDLDRGSHRSRVLPLREVDPLVLSEVLGVLAVLASKGT